MKKFLLIKDIKVQNANAFSSVYTAGFPAVTAFMGFVHKLQRDINKKSDFSNVKFSGVGIFSKEFRIQCYRDNKFNNFNSCLRRHPLIVKNSEAKTAAIVEEIFCDITFSLLIECSGVRVFNQYDIKKDLFTMINKSKFAGGDILSYDFKSTEFITFDNDVETFKNKIGKKLMVSYALIDRHDLLEPANSENSMKDLISFLTINSRCIKEEDEINWEYYKKQPGWFVPVPIGFIGITEPNKINGQRDSASIHRFVEPVITLGEFKLAYRIKELSDLLWYYDFDEINSLYICKNKKGEKNE
jgi:CRISPR-associated protein Csy2